MTSASIGSQIKVIFLDIGNVILCFDYLRAARGLSEATGLPLEEIEHHFFFSELEREFSKGRITPEEFYGALSKKLNLALSFQRFVELWNDIFWQNQGMEEMIEELKPRYRLGAITNTNLLHFRYWLESFPVLSRIDVFVPSHEAHERKPDRAIFELALQKAGASPSEALFIDDILENVEAAKAIGMAGLAFQEAKQLRVALTHLGILNPVVNPPKPP